MKISMGLQYSLFALGFVLTATSAQAHFKLDAPASWIQENQQGDPQKLAPCGGTTAAGDYDPHAQHRL